jgi:hypothetical protein
LVIVTSTVYDFVTNPAHIDAYPEAVARELAQAAD